MFFDNFDRSILNYVCGFSSYSLFLPGGQLHVPSTELHLPIPHWQSDAQFLPHRSASHLSSHVAPVYPAEQTHFPKNMENNFPFI